jgi:signal peptidase I
MTDSSRALAAEPQPPTGPADAASVDLDQARATVEVLHGAATLLQAAIEQRESLQAEIASAEEALAVVLQAHLRTARAVTEAEAQLERTRRDVEQVEQVRSEQSRLVTEFDRLVQAALDRRSALVHEVVELERRRDALLVAAAHSPAPRTMPPPARPHTITLPTLPRSIALPTFAPPGLGQRSLPRPRQMLTIVSGVILLGLAILLTPISQVFGGLQLLAVMSGSMEPTIPVGGIVGIRPVPANELKVGDVITFANQTSPDVLVTHRIVSLEARNGQAFLTTKGDANDSVDALAAPATRAVGRVDFSLPWLGYLMIWLASPLAKVGILAIAIVGFALPSVKRAAEPAATGPPGQVAAAAPVAETPAMPTAGAHTGVSPPHQAAPARPSPDYVAITPSYAALERELEALLAAAKDARPSRGAA